MPTLVPSRIATIVVLWSDGPKMDTGSGLIWRNRANSSSTILAATNSSSSAEPARQFRVLDDPQPAGPDLGRQPGGQAVRRDAP